MGPFSRRDLLIQSGVLGGALATGSPAAIADAPQAEGPTGPAKRLKLIVTGGHPGDPEYGCGGTVARYTDLGHEVVLLYLNKGEWPPKAEGTGRVAEAKAACEILKARPAYAGQFNSQAVVDAAHYEAFRKILEAERPDAVFTHWPIDNHADHRAISMLVYDAWLRLKKRFALYYYEVSSGEDTVQFAPTHYVDITETEPRKRRACYAHASQTPDRYYALQDQVTRMRGIESGHRQAEAFIRHVQSPDFTLPLASS
jgi:N-acetylglucosamine malate deacetylase 1